MVNNSATRTPSAGNQYRMFLLGRNNEAVMLDLKDEKERTCYELRCNCSIFTPAHTGSNAKAMAIFDNEGVLVFGKLDPTVEKTFTSWMQIS